MHSVRRFGFILLPALALGLAVGALAAGSGGVNGAKLMQSQGCASCHAAKTKLVGPPWSWVAWRYRKEPRQKAVEAVAKFIISGGTGYWSKWVGGIPMPAHSNLSMKQAEAIASWVLSQPPAAPPKS